MYVVGDTSRSAHERENIPKKKHGQALCEVGGILHCPHSIMGGLFSQRIYKGSVACAASCQAAFGIATLLLYLLVLRTVSTSTIVGDLLLLRILAVG